MLRKEGFRLKGGERERGGGREEGHVFRKEELKERGIGMEREGGPVCIHIYIYIFKAEESDRDRWGREGCREGRRKRSIEKGVMRESMEHHVKKY